MDKLIKSTFSDLVAPVDLIPLAGKELGLQLTVWMRNSYEFFLARFTEQGPELLLGVVQGQMPVDMIGRQYERIQSESDEPLLLVFKELKARERDRLVRRKVPFMIPGKFLFAPMLGFIGETPLFEGKWNTAVAAVGLSPWAETVLIKRLLDDSLELKSGIELAMLFGVAPMTMSRTLRELERFDLCFLERHGTEKRVRFEPKDWLWAKGEKLLSSPVVATVDLAELPLELPLSGESALEHYTMLVGLPPSGYAISKREFLALKKAGRVALPKLGDETLRLELWRRDPRVLAVDGYVDPISLYLCVKNSSDERVQLECGKMMNELGLDVGEDG